MRRSLVLAFIFVAGACHRAALPITMPADLGSAPVDGAQVRHEKERCNGIDDDGDGKIDEGCPIRLSFAVDWDDKNLVIGNGRVAWTHPVFGDGGADAEIRVLPIPNGPTKGDYSVSGTATWTGVPLSLGGDRIAFRPDDRRETVVVEVLVTQQKWTHTTSAPGGQQVLAPDGRTLVYADGNTLAAWDLDSGGVTTLTTTAYTVARSLLVTGGRAVWLDQRDRDVSDPDTVQPDLYWGDLATGTGQLVVHLVPTAGLGAPLAFDGTHAYIDELHDLNFSHIIATGTCQRARYDVASGARMPIGASTTAMGDACANYADVGAIALFDATRGVREKDPRRASDLYLFDLADGGNERQLTKYPRRSWSPQIWDGRLVWLDDRNDVANVYMMDLRDVDQGDLSPEGVTP
jgi:beta propeller repeat protein